MKPSIGGPRNTSRQENNISRTITNEMGHSTKHRKKQVSKKRKSKHAPRERLPKRIVAFGNADKQFHEKWTQGRDLLDIPHPFRLIAASKPNAGKTNTIKNIICHIGEGRRPFQLVLVIHCDGSSTKEYEDLDCEMLDEIPMIAEFRDDLKTLVILEDLGYINMDRDQRSRLERLFGYGSTHKNISTMLTAQDPFRIMTTVRRCANFFVVWNNHDTSMIATLATKLNIRKEVLCTLFREKCPNYHDSLWFDFTANTPAPYRLNGYDTFDLDQ